MAEDSKVVELQVLSPLLLHDYVPNGTLPEVKNAILHGKIPVDQRNEFQQTALHVACLLGKEDVASLLIDFRANAHLQDSEGINPLIAASKSGAVNCVKLLIKCRADVHATDNVGWSALMWACYKGHAEIVQVLLNEGANVHVHVAYSMSSLLWAAGRGHLSIVKMLCEKGGKVNATDKFGSTALMWACRRGFVDIVNVLFDFKADADAVGANGANALISSIKNSHDNCAKVILNRAKVNMNHTDKDTNSALSYAAKYGKYETIILLLNSGAYLNLADKNGDTPLIKAVKHGHHEAVRALLSRFADVDIRGKNNITALHIASELGHVGIVRELLACNADMEAVNDDLETPLLRAVKNKNVTITRMLLDKGAKVTAADKKRDTPLHIAIRARSLRLVKLLLRNPRDGRLLYQPNKAGETPYNLDAVHNKSILANVFGAKNMSPESAMHEVSGDGIQHSHDLYSSALADILCEPTLTPPLTVGLYAKWGSGKSFLLNKLQEQMKLFTSANQVEMPQKPRILPFVILFFVSVFIGILAASLTPDMTMRIISGTVAACFIFFSYTILILLVTLGLSVGWKWAASVANFLNTQYNYFALLFKLWFMRPPAPKQTCDGKAIPVRFLFTTYNRLTSVGGETSLAEMIGVLSCLAEKNLGYFAVRLYRAFKVEVRDESSTVAKYKRVCCIPTFTFGIFFLFSLAAIILLVTVQYGASPSMLEDSLYDGINVTSNSTSSYPFSVLTACAVVLACLDVLIIVVVSPTLFTMCGAMMLSQRSRVLSAAQHTKSQERLMQQLKQEVDLLCQTVIAIDAFMGLQTRMCVIINGLDSCEQDKVLQVLDTVHVLFSQRPYITILAIDPVIISKAIHNNLKSVFRDANISGYDYLRNIVHLPFYMRDKTQILPRKFRSLADREDGLTDADTDPEDLAVVVNNSRKNTPGRTGSFQSRRSANVRRSHKSIDLSRLMYSEDWFNTVSPQLMKRILNIVSLTGRLLRADGIEFSWGKLAAWINLTEQWPYRTSFLIHSINKSENKFVGTELLRNIFDRNQVMLSQNDPMMTIDSSDERSFCAFLSARFLTVRDLKDFLPSTVNLDPKLRDLISQDPYRQIQDGSAMKSFLTPDSVIQHRYVSFPTNDSSMMEMQEQMQEYSATPTLPQSASTASAFSGIIVPVEDWSTDDVCQYLQDVKGLASSNLEKYKNFVEGNNVNGSVLLSCDLDDLKKELFAPFGDWSLIKNWIIKLRSYAISDDHSEVSVTTRTTSNDYRQRQNKASNPSPSMPGNTAKLHSEDSLNFTSLQGSERVAYNRAFKEYLKLQPSTTEDQDDGLVFKDPVNSEKLEERILTDSGQETEDVNSGKLQTLAYPQTRISQDLVTSDVKDDSHSTLLVEDVLNGNNNIPYSTRDTNDNENIPLLILHQNTDNDNLNANL